MLTLTDADPGLDNSLDQGMRMGQGISKRCGVTYARPLFNIELGYSVGYLSHLGTPNCPCRLLPQHSAVPSMLIPHACSIPASIATNSPEGGSERRCQLLPQHSAVRSVRIPHE